ncbi:Enhancer of rudimentary [Dillenia turbinata]|uniref:Enhancer of rudimentary n=1 Tax=Dillenia turbinata TaxID=194707 RepID=A0AAN8Z5X1_9MAGN
MQANRHTIILMQSSHNKATRTFMDYDSISQAMDEINDAVWEDRGSYSVHLYGEMESGWERFLSELCFKAVLGSILSLHGLTGICGLYERKLKELNPASRNITYDIGDLYNFIDGLADLSALVYDHTIQAYLPYDRQWIKQRTLQQLKKLAR